MSFSRQIVLKNPKFMRIIICSILLISLNKLFQKIEGLTQKNTLSIFYYKF